MRPRKLYLLPCQGELPHTNVTETVAWTTCFCSVVAMGIDAKCLPWYCDTTECTMAFLIAFFRSHHKQKESISLSGLLLIFKWHFWIHIKAYSFTYFFNCFFLLQFPNQKKKIKSPKNIKKTLHLKDGKIKKWAYRLSEPAGHI